MANDGYWYKVKPYIEQNKVRNPLLKTSFIGTGFELKELGKVLRPDENIRYLTACKEGNSKVLVCVTDLRLIILDKGLIVNKYQQAIFLDRIASTVRGRGLYFGNVIVQIQDAPDPHILSGFWGKDTEDFINAVEDARFEYERSKYGQWQGQPRVQNYNPRVSNVEPARPYVETPNTFGASNTLPPRSSKRPTSNDVGVSKPASKPVSADLTAEQLTQARKLKTLKDKGILSEYEYRERINKILNE